MNRPQMNRDDGSLLGTDISKYIKPDTKDILRVFIISLSAFLLLSLCGGILPKSGGWLIFNIYVPQILAWLMPILIFIKWKRLGFRVTLRLNPISLSTAVTAGLMGIIFIIGLAGLNMLLTPIFSVFENLAQETMGHLTRAAEANIYLFFIGVTVIPAVCAEVVFRGFILSGLIAEHGQVRAVIFSSLLFGMLHVIPSQILLMTLFGILLGVITLRSNSLFVPIIIHFVNNVLAVLLILNPDWWTKMG
jgi:membrane protease YdiL (CAAX protease family)